mmetsp:Transcript_19551/g.57977  ORF Transcript_19551/g.57977 Transcript_19551/m.57977 type:complete len:97 (+) Transcript_19551:1359-1649(+)|eukprot:363053-Chlamydomonas_euryale.AAC.1
MPHAQVLGQVELRAPRIPVLSNVTAAPFPDDVAEIRVLLSRQLVEPVRWEETLNELLAVRSGQCSHMYELGPSKQIKAMVKRVDPDAWKALENVQP